MKKIIFTLFLTLFVLSSVSCICAVDEGAEIVEGSDIMVSGNQDDFLLAEDSFHEVNTVDDCAEGLDESVDAADDSVIVVDSCDMSDLVSDIPSCVSVCSDAVLGDFDVAAVKNDYVIWTEGSHVKTPVKILGKEYIKVTVKAYARDSSGKGIAHFPLLIGQYYGPERDWLYNSEYNYKLVFTDSDGYYTFSYLLYPDPKIYCYTTVCDLQSKIGVQWTDVYEVGRQY